MRGSNLGTTIVAIAMLAAACTSPAEAPPPTPTSTATVRAMTHYLDGLVRVRQFRGAVEVRRGDEVLLSKGYDLADVRSGVPNGPDTRFRIASLTKQLTALAVLILQEQGRVKVTDRVCRHLPACPEAWETITVEQLLTHTAGLYDYVEISGGDPRRYATAYGREPTPERLVRTFAARPLDFPPGARHDYSSSGYVLLGYLIERVSGSTYGDFLAEHILGPLGMTGTAYDPAVRAAPGDARGYRTWTAPSVRAPDAVSFAGGGVYSTATDLSRWNQFLLTGSPALVEQNTLAQLIRPRVAADQGTQYGYGLYTLGTGDTTVHFHGGGLPGFATYNEIRPAAGLSIVVLSNLDTAEAVEIGRNLDLIATT